MPRLLRNTGFSLVEMAVVLLILGILLGGGLSVFSAQLAQQKIKDSSALLEDAREALIGFAASNAAADARPYLPCPDKTTAAGAGTANDGQEDRVAGTGACVTQEGNLPWTTLGQPPTDAWGNHLRYRVAAPFSNSTTGITLGPPASIGDIRVCTVAACAPPTSVQAINLPAIIISHGGNGFGAVNGANNNNVAPGGGDELQNTNANTDFVSHEPRQAGGTGGEFDDLLLWLPSSTLFNRLIQAGRF